MNLYISGNNVCNIAFETIWTGPAVFFARCDPTSQTQAIQKIYCGHGEGIVVWIVVRRNMQICSTISVLEYVGQDTPQWDMARAVYK